MSYNPNQTLSNETDFFAAPKIRKEVDTTDGTVIYQGYANLLATTAQGVWRIKRTTISGSLISIEWANGNTQFYNVWDNRGSLSYS